MTQPITPENPNSLNFDRETAAAFSGYRTPKIMATATCPPLIISQIENRLDAAIKTLIEEGYTTFLVGMAEGFDIMAAEAVIRAKPNNPDIRLVAVIPFAAQADRFSPDTKRRYRNILDERGLTIILSENYSAGVYHRRNNYLVDNASALVCYFDGQDGGTKYTVERALRRNLAIINLADNC